MSATSIAVRPAIPRQAWLLVAVGLLIAVAAAVVYIGRPQEAKPPVNGLIVFGRMNDALGDTVPYTMNPDGSNIRQLLPFTVEGPFWSPDGSKIAIGFGYVNADGTGRVEFDDSALTFHVYCWDWSPDGKRLLCEGFSDSEDPQIHGVYTVRATDGGDLQRVDQPGDQGVPGAYSPDGKTIAYNGKFNGVDALILVGIDGSNRRRLLGPGFGGPSWAPDGASILTSRNGILYSVDVQTKKLSAVRPQEVPGAVIYTGQYSPDGMQILLRRDMGNRNIDLWTMAADGSDLVRLTNTPEDERFIDWGTHPVE